MATVSEVKAGLNAISEQISGARQVRDQAKSRLLAARNQLNSIPTTYADVIATIDGYTPTGSFETLTQDEKAKLASEFTALKTQLESELTALGVSFS